jgi:hypothetical protein
MEITRYGLIVAVGCIVVLTVTALIVIPVLGGSPIVGMSTSCEVGEPDRLVVARVGDEVLFDEEMRLTGMDYSHAEAWVEDELLAQLAMEWGLENPRLSRYVERRARQIYLRDLMMDQVFAMVRFPSADDVFDFMRSDSLLYMVERHYYHILMADSAMADSIYQKLERGETFQTTAERISIGQKAGLGGDLGFLVGGELTERGLPESAGMLDGLSSIYSSSLGWHIFLVTETRALTDTHRVVESLTEVLYNQMIQSELDSVLASIRTRIPCEIDESWRF